MKMHSVDLVGNTSDQLIPPPIIFFGVFFNLAYFEPSIIDSAHIHRNTTFRLSFLRIVFFSYVEK